MSGLTLLAVDDERPALDDLVWLLERAPGVRRVHAVASAAEALTLLAREPVDGLFLDVRMPDVDGLQLAHALRRAERLPGVVFVSAHSDFAVSAFELRALDYLVKPVSRRRLEEAVGRLTEHAAEERVAVDLPRGGTRLIERASILLVQAHGDYVRVHADGGRFLLRATMAELEERWSPHGFARVHRGYLVNLRRAVELREQTLRLDDGRSVPVARRALAELRRRLAA